MLLALLTNAWASDYGEYYGSIKKVLSKRKAAVALQKINVIEQQFQNPTTIVSRSDLHRLWVYRGYAYFLMGNSVDAFASWRQALAIHIEAPVDPYLQEDEKVQEIWTSLQSDMRRRRTPLTITVPAVTKKEKYFVNGQSIENSLIAYPGLHLAQAECENSEVRSAWSHLTSQPAWHLLCLDQTKLANRPKLVPPKLQTLGVGLISAGGALITAGISMHYTAVRPAYQEVVQARNKPESVTRKQANQFTSTFQSARRTTLWMLAGGLVLGGSGFYVMTSSPSNDVQIQLKKSF